MGLRLVAVTYDAPDVAAVAAFWAEVLGRSTVEEPGGAWLPGTETQVGLRFVAADTEQSGRNVIHLHLTSAEPEDQLRTVERCLALGARHVDIGQRPEEPHIVLADPVGNLFCVIEAGNGYLAGTGFLGEVACFGSHDVGLFWRDALGWPLIWDRDGETAIQSPKGGTKVAWGGSLAPDAPRPNRQRLALEADDVAADIDRLVALGATSLGEHDGGADLADPDGNEFSLSPA